MNSENNIVFIIKALKKKSFSVIYNSLKFKKLACVKLGLFAVIDAANETALKLTYTGNNVVASTSEVPRAAVTRRRPRLAASRMSLMLNFS